MLEAAAWRVGHDARMATTAAWMTVALSRQKRLPSLTKVLGDKPQRRVGPQTVEEQAAIIRALHAQLGGELVSNG